MSDRALFVSLGRQRYRVERPFGDLPANAGRVTDVAWGTDGHLFVLLRRDPLVDGPAPAIVALAPDGSRVAALGQGLIDDGHMLAIDGEDRLFVVDRDAHEIVILDRAGQRLGGIGRRHAPQEPFNHPCDVAFARDGTVLVADGYGASHVHRFELETAITGELTARSLGSFGRPGSGAGEFTTPHAVWVLPDGRIAVADRENNRVQLFTAEGAFLQVLGDLHKPMAIWGDGQGRLHVTDQVPRLSLFSPEGELVGRCRPVLNGAHGITGDPDGCLYLAEGDPSRVTRLVPV